MIETHGFMTGGWRKCGEDVGHVVLGFLPLDLIWYCREWTTVRLPWPYRGQWPPGDIMHADGGVFDTDDLEEAKRLMSNLTWPVECLPLDRVSDSARDELGRSIGAQLRVVVLVGLLIWRW